MINAGRIHSLNQLEYQSGSVVYWMSRDQRVRDNWALLYAQNQALKYRVPLKVVFCRAPKFLGARKQQYAFMMEGLRQVSQDLNLLHIPFHWLKGDPEKEVPEFLNRTRAGLLVTDFDPLKIKKRWKEKVCMNVSIPVADVDTHNIIPCRIASDKQEYAAYTLRPKIHRKLYEFLEPFPELKPHPFSIQTGSADQTGEKIGTDDLKIKETGDRTQFFQSGEKHAFSVLERFIREKLDHYSRDRNDPAKDGISGLSPYLHFGQISAQKIAIEVMETDVNEVSKESFLEELIVRRELSDNYCYYNNNYDSFEGFPQWARKTLSAHRRDPRENIYQWEQFENAETHDPLWNAAQMEMVKKGKMHGYIRMYWAKKILEWTSSVEAAVETAIALNDKYELDGRDPNGYTGIAWAIGGVHDRAWFERPVFGKVRYMSERGCRSKFDVDQYIQQIERL
ncbi:deoxyribodipyrimidine photo-lyase [bacterium]|nr:deoxyribodipyrimidine photo-lyase [bacterium]